MTSRLICNKNLQVNRKPCPDFEIRFCCPENLKQALTEAPTEAPTEAATEALTEAQRTFTTIESVSYSESDFDENGLKISQELINLLFY